MKLRKGEISKQELLDNFLKIFSEEGIRVTMNQLSKHLGVSIGKITYHFPTKDAIFTELGIEYVGKYIHLISSIENFSDNLADHFRSFPMIFDLQMKYKPVFTYMAMASVSDAKMFKQMRDSYSQDYKRIMNDIKTLCDKGFLKTSILDDFDIFFHQLVILFSMWVPDASVYSLKVPYKKLRKKYTMSIVMLYYPYLTPKGMKVYEEFRKEFN
jgi:AcrR family transcriptional regulator